MGAPGKFSACYSRDLGVGLADWRSGRSHDDWREAARRVWALLMLAANPGPNLETDESQVWPPRTGDWLVGLCPREFG
jgi:hypothetical protein